MKQILTKQNTSRFQLFFASFIFGFGYVLIKIILEEVSTNTFLTIRFLSSSILLGIFLAFIKKKNIFKNFRYGMILGIILWLMYATMTMGLKYTTASNSAFITGLFVVFVPILNFIIFKQKITQTKVLSMILSILGLYTLTGGINGINLGDIITILSALTYALYIIVGNNILKKNINSLVLLFQQFFVLGILSLILMIGSGDTITEISFITIISLFTITILGTLIAFLAQIFGQKHVPALQSSIILSLQSVFAVLSAWMLGLESLTTNTIVGGILILSSLIFSELKPIKIRNIKKNYLYKKIRR